MPIIDLRYAIVKSTGEVAIYRDAEIVSGMNVGGDVRLGNELTDITTIGGTLNVEGNSTFSELSIVSGLNVAGNVSFGESLTDSTIVSGTLNVAGNSNFSSAHVASSFSVGGDVTLGDGANDKTNVAGELVVGGASNLSSLNISSSINSSGDFFTNSTYYHINPLTNSWSSIGEKEIVYTFNNSDFITGVPFEIQINHGFGHFPTVKVLDNNTFEEIITEVLHVDRNTCKIIFSSRTKEIFFPLGNTSPSISLLISLM